MSESAYPMVPLSEVLEHYCEYINAPEARMYPKLSVRLYGKGVVLDTPADGAILKMKRHQIAKSGQVILSEIWGKKGAVGIVPPEGEGALCTSHFFLFNVRRERLEPGYLQAIFTANYLEDQLNSEAKGTTGYAAVRPKHLLAASIPLPPLDEQRRIVTRIEELAAKIEEARGLNSLARNESSALNETVVGDAFRHLSDVPCKRLATLTMKIGSGSTPAGGRSVYQSSGIPFIRSQNVRMRRFQWDDIAYIDPATHDKMRGTQVFSHDVLLNITGASIGRVALAPEDIGEANVNQHVAIIRPTPNLHPRFLMYWLSQPVIQEVIRSEQKGATRQGFTKKQIEAFEVPVPSRQDQQTLIKYLDDLSTRLTHLTEQQSLIGHEIDALLPTVLDKTLSGEL